jgi:glyoxylase-like metal-dependent hydrolase (beta-lactamase superfamily II)
MREIVQGIVTWESFSEPHGYDFNGYFLRHPGGNLCIDPVDPPEDALALLGREGVARILITNRNHVRKAMVVREQSGAPVTIHPDDAAYARQQGATIDAELRPGERIGPLTVVGVPGKSPGEVALHWPERRLLVVGDAAIGNPPGRLSLLRERVMDDPPRLRRSLRALAELEPDVVLVGDGVSIVGGAGAQLRALVASFPD